MVRIKAVLYLHDFVVRLTFTDGTAKDVDLSIYLHGPIFDPVRNNPTYFRTIHVDCVAGTVTWDNGADIDPDVLYKGLTPAWMEEESAAA